MSGLGQIYLVYVFGNSSINIFKAQNSFDESKDPSSKSTWEVTLVKMYTEIHSMLHTAEVLRHKAEYYNFYFLK